MCAAIDRPEFRGATQGAVAVVLGDIGFVAREPGVEIDWRRGQVRRQ